MMRRTVDPSIEAAIRQAAQEAGVDPAYAMAVAERESRFDPLAKSSKTIRGLYQMRGDLRAQYGVGDSTDPLDQARGWMRSLQDIRSDMRRVLGRDPTDEEAYLGHHFGAVRAARTLGMDPDTPVDAVFTPQEMALNPHFARAGTIGNLDASITSDIGKRMARFGGVDSVSPSAEPADLSSFGDPVDVAQASSPADLSSFGDPVDAQGGPAPADSATPADLSSFGEAVS